MDLRRNPDKKLAPRRTYVRSEVFELDKSRGDRHPVEAAQEEPLGREGAPKEGPKVFCVDCVNLLYLDGVPQCAEFKFLIWAEALRDGIPCNKQIRLGQLSHFKMNKSSIYPVIKRLVKRGKIMIQRSLVYHPDAPRRKYWTQEVYLPSILHGRIKSDYEKITLGEKSA